jgi:serine/threonine protein kinase/tetratricopeptide (TPR) repeat protein
METGRVNREGSGLNSVTSGPRSRAQPQRDYNAVLRLNSGTRLGPYEILGPLGAGGMGEVYRARDDRLARDVAIKILPSWAAGDPEMLQRFESEARAAGALNHPGIVSIHDIGQAGVGPFIVSELLDGETLRQVLARGPIHPTDAIDLMRQAADALDVAHAHGIVHRDLKPENLFVMTDGRLKILDFGIARVAAQASPSEPTRLSAGHAPTMPGAVIGTYGYMAPEQLDGLPVDERSDVFALGAVLYEMLSGRPAFPGHSHLEIADGVRHADPPRLSKISAPLHSALMGALEKDPARRCQSARDFELALRAASGTTPAAPEAASGEPRRRALIGLALFAAVVFVFVGYAWIRPRLSSAPPIRSLAVLPPPQYSDRPDDAYFADSMAEAVIADLARISSLTVTSRTSVMRYRGTTKTARQIASELGVEALVETSIFKAGDRVRITANLIDGRTDRQIWSHTYQRDLRDVLALQSEVARAITREISATLTPQEERLLDETRVVNPAAHEAYLRGRYELNRFTEESLRKAVGHFKDAIRIDARFAQAHAGLSDAYSRLRSVFAPPDSVMPLAKEAALKAVELDDVNAEAHVALGFVLLFYDFDRPGAEREFRRAIEINRNLASAHQGYAAALSVLRRHDEAAAEIEQAMRLDPLSPLVRTDASWVYYLGRQYELSALHAQKSVELDPGFWVGYTQLGLAYEKLGKHSEALSVLQKARSLDDNPFILEMLGGLHATTGNHAAVRATLAELGEQAKRRYVCPYEIATIHASLNDRQSTMKWLEKGLQDRADCMPWMGTDPKLDLLHRDPEFQSLLKRAGLDTPAPHAR